MNGPPAADRDADDPTGGRPGGESSPTYGRVVIVGVGLLGGSLGLALLSRGLARSVVGVGRSAASLAVAARRGCVTEATTDLAAAVTGADLVVICTPVAAIGETARTIAAHVAPSALVTDVGSVKAAVVAAVARDAPSLPFVGSHPMAGGTRVGAEAARADLFDSATTIVTPTPATSTDLPRRAAALWRAVGCHVVTMAPDRHDEIVASVSHLPHVVAAARASVPDEDALACVGRGFLDSTRIAGGDVELWRQILTLNRPAVLAAVDRFGERLTAWRSALAGADDGAITHLLTRGKRVRDALAD